MDQDGIPNAQGRTYGGLTADERAQQRRSALLDAALELFGTEGYAATSVNKICQTSDLTKRYFYKSFKDREDCLAALYRHLIKEITLATLDALQTAGPDPDTIISKGLRAFVTYLTDDPRRARVVLVEVVGVSHAMEIQRHDVLQSFADIVCSIWLCARVAEGASDATQNERLTAITLVGGVNHLLVSWLMKGCTQPPDDLVDVCATLFSAVRERLDTY